MQNITFDLLDSLGVEGNSSMRLQMVLKYYQNPVGTPNSFLGSTSGGTPLPWNASISGRKNAS